MADDAHTTFAIDLDTSGTVTAAKAGASATENLRGSIEGSLAAIAKGNSAQALMAKAGLKGSNAYKALRKETDLYKGKLKGQIEAYGKAGGNLGLLGERAKKSGDASAGGIKNMVAAMNTVGGPLGGLISKGNSLKEVFGKAGAAGVYAAAAAAAIALVLAIGVLTVALAKFGLEAANATRAELLMLEGMMRVPNWFGIAAGSATQLQAAITKVSDATSLGRDKIAAFGQELYLMGLRGANLDQALEAVSMGFDAAGERGAAWAKAMVTSSALTGRSVKKAADLVKGQFGGVVAKKMLDLNVQAGQLQKHLKGLFSGLQIEGFLGGLKTVLDLFSQQTATGRALKVMLETLLNPLYKGLATVGPVAKRFFQGMIIAALELTIIVLKVRNAIRDALGNKELFSGIDWGTKALWLGEHAVYAVVIAAGALGAAFSVVATVCYTLGALLALPFVIFGVAIYKAGQAGTWFVGKLVEVVDYFANIDWGGLATSMIDGLVNGIKAGAQWVIDAVKNLASKAWGAFKSVLGISSPSKVFFEMGGFVAEGAAAGIDAGAGGVQDSAASMLPAPPTGRGASASGSVSRGGNVYNFNVALPAGTPAEQARSLYDEFVRLVQGGSSELGAPT